MPGQKRLKLASPPVATPSLFFPQSPIQSVASLPFLNGTKPLPPQGLRCPLCLDPVLQVPAWLPPSPSSGLSSNVTSPAALLPKLPCTCSYIPTPFPALFLFLALITTHLAHLLCLLLYLLYYKVS